MKKLLEQFAYGLGLINLSTKKPVNFTMKPSPTHKKLFEEVKNIQTELQILYFELSKDLSSFTFDDEFYNYLNSIRCPRQKRIVSFYLRSDYLLDKKPEFVNENPEVVNYDHYTYKQVEINTIAQCFSIFGPIVNRIHSRLYPETVISNSDEQFIKYLSVLKSEYEKLNDVKETIIAMIDNDTTESSSNLLEKMKLIEMCFDKNIRVIHVKIDDINFYEDKIFYENNEISIVYYRWFYNYDQYDEKSKDLRRRIECSEAISLPSAEFQMINSKAFQSILTDLEVLKRYTNIPHEIKKHFGEFKEVNSTTIQVPEGWLLKDISEGGGHLNKNVTKSSFLMKKFISPTFQDSFISDDKERHLISELSIFGGLIVVDGEIKYNEEGGYMVRSKDENSLEGGVCVGAGGLDSIYFVD